MNITNLDAYTAVVGYAIRNFKPCRRRSPTVRFNIDRKHQDDRSGASKHSDYGQRWHLDRPVNSPPPYFAHRNWFAR